MARRRQKKGARPSSVGLLYLLDANVLIGADRDFYGLEQVPEFWEWLLHHGNLGTVKICEEIMEEMIDGTSGPLPDWLRQTHVQAALLLADESDPTIVSRVVYDGYAPDLTDIDIQKLGRDPFLIAYALMDPLHRRVVTTEVSAPKKQGANKKVPDVCRLLGVTPLNAFEFFKDLKFTTRWNSEGSPPREPEPWE